MMKCLIGLIILVLLASEYSCEPCKDFKSVVCTRSMRLEVSAAKIYVYSLMTLDDCSDYYKEEYMTYDLYELCDSSDETECDDKNFETYNYKNCINLREGKDCSVKTEDDTLDDHKIQKHIFTIKGEDEFEMRVIFTTTEENFTKEFTLKDTSTSGMQGLPCQTDEITYTQEFNPDNVKIDIEIENVQKEFSTLYFRPQGSIRILKALNTQFKYQEEDDYHITLFNSSNIQILFRLFKWFETSEGQIASTKLDTYKYVCGGEEYDDMNGLPICVLNEKSKFVSIEFYMNFRLGLPDLLPYRSLYYDPDLSAIFHRAKDKKKQDPTEPEDNEEEKKLQIAYIVAPVVTVVAVAAIIVGIVIFKKHKMAQQKKMTKESYELDTTEYDRGEEIDTIQPTQWKDGKKP